MTYQDFLNLVNSLPSKTDFTVSIEFCAKYGYSATKNEVIQFGKIFVNNYQNHNTILRYKGSDNKHYYQKK